MSRPIAHNKVSEPINGSIVNGDDVGNIVYTVDGRGNNYYDGYADRLWVPSADGAAPIVFVTDTFTQGIDGDAATAVPMFFACAGTSSAAVIYTANRLPGMSGQNFSTIGEALEYVTRNGYFILEGNDPFEGINADGLVLDVDASKMSSYPQTGTTWYDLSGNQNSSTLTNGPTFDSNGWLVFDGVDDYSVGTGTLGQDCTVELWISSSNYNGKIPISIDGVNYGSGPNIFCTSNIIAWNTGDGGNNAFSNSSYPNAQWHHIVVTNDYNVTAKLYIDGKLIGTANPLDATTTGTNKFWIARFHGDNNYTIAARIKSARVYNSALTEAQVKQNYFGSPIVTDGLVFAVDANNIVSYPKSGTAWYNLTGSVPSASLFNSPIFTLPNGGAIDFDGTDDYATTPSTTISGDQTLCAWGVVEGPPNSPAGIITQHDYASTANFGINYVSNGGYKFGASIGYTNGTREYDTKTTNYLVQEGVIWNVVLVYSSSNNTIYWYVNGQLDSTYALSATPKSTNWPIGLGRWDPSYPAYYFTGKIFNSKIYNRALSAAEVQQNYQAEQYRFKGPQGIVTNGLVLNFDASNLDSYPGTGATWYTLVGSDNGTLINGPLFSTEAGGCIVFDGVDDYVSFGNPLDQSQLSQVWTVQAWINITTKPPQLLIGGLAAGQYIEFVQGNNSLLYLNSGANDYYTYGGQFTAQGWVLATFRFNNATGDRQIWRNLSNISTGGPNNTSTPGGQSSTFSIGTSSSDTVLGKIGNLLFYNRYLSDAEITQNYNAQKGRFGL